MERAKKVEESLPCKSDNLSVTKNRERASQSRELQSQGMELTFSMGFSRISRAMGALRFVWEATGKRYT